MDGTFSHEAFGWVEQMDATRRLGRIGMDGLNEKWGYTNGCMEGWMDTRMHEWARWDGMDRDRWMDESPEAKPRMVGSVQWQACNTHAIWAWAKKKKKKAEKGRKKMRH